MKKKASELRPGDRVVVTVTDVDNDPLPTSLEFEEIWVTGYCDDGITAKKPDSMVEVLPPGYDDVGRENRCDACGGTGHPISGLLCMCRGTGKMSEAAVTLRETLVETETERDALKALLAEGVEWAEMLGKPQNIMSYPYKLPCRVCGAFSHSPSCRLAGWLSKVKP